MPNLLRISEAVSLGLHTCAILTTQAGQPLSVGHVASLFSVSEAHLSKVLQRLAKAGLVESTRGPRGGFTLKKPPDEVTLLEVYEALEGPLPMEDCLLSSPFCAEGGCILGDLMQSVGQQVRDYLSSTYLSTVAEGFEERGARPAE